MIRTISILFAATTFATGLAFAAPASAQAAPDATWEALAGCESGHRWHLNTGNGYYGGLQFYDPTWDAYRRGQFEHRADLASRQAQIIVAERVLAGQGWGAWPACSRKLGLR